MHLLVVSRDHGILQLSQTRGNDLFPNIQGDCWGSYLWGAHLCTPGSIKDERRVLQEKGVCQSFSFKGNEDQHPVSWRPEVLDDSSGSSFYYIKVLESRSWMFSKAYLLKGWSQTVITEIVKPSRMGPTKWLGSGGVPLRNIVRPWIPTWVVVYLFVLLSSHELSCFDRPCTHHIKICCLVMGSKSAGSTNYSLEPPKTLNSNKPFTLSGILVWWQKDHVWDKRCLQELGEKEEAKNENYIFENFSTDVPASSGLMDESCTFK